MSDLDCIAERDARDRIADRLGFGFTAPIQNLPLPDKTLATPFDTQANIPLGYSQAGVSYTVSVAECKTLSEVTTPKSEGGPLILKTEKITENRTFNICAFKDNGSPLVALLGVVRVRVGLDTNLDARILTRKSSPPDPLVRLLDPTLDHPYPDTVARLTPFGTQVTVQIDDAQEGIDYTLESDAEPNKAISQTVRGRGPGKSIELRSVPLKEDLVISIRAQRGTNAAENELLEIKLPMKLMADPGLAVSLAEGPIAPFQATHRLRIGASQASAKYQVFARPIPDIDYRPSGLPGNRVLTIDVEGEVDDDSDKLVPIALPPAFLEWQLPSGFASLTESVEGNGGDLVIPLPAAVADQLLLVQATKSHARPNAALVPSSIRLTKATALLVRPNPNPRLDLVLNVESGGIALHGGEPGVFYYLRPQEEANPQFQRPAYVHKRDASNPTLNKGIGQPTTGGLTVGIDLAIARDPNPYDPPFVLTDPTTMSPFTPIVDTQGLTQDQIDTDIVLYLRAKKAQTGLLQPLDKQAQIPVSAEVSAEPSEITAGQQARFTVRASAPTDRYELRRNDQSEGPAQQGNGNDLAFDSNPIETDTLFFLRITRPHTEGIPLARDIPFRIRVRTGT
jgi:hypothetical protein